ncbi:MAG: hypothetical protein QNJ40_21920 [Xanthomonadales bacterium]|nr:hypothetical protein [Xanthomonadales bacterium]
MLRRTVRLAGALLVPLMLMGCAGQVVIESKFPTPVVEPLPYQVGVYYAPEFTGYIYSDDESKLEFELGSKQTAVYDKIFASMFQRAVLVGSVETPQAENQLDLLVEPVLQEYAFLSPGETATNFYSVSMKYQIRLYGEGGTIIGYWPFVAYGKDRKQFVNSNVSLGEATTLALRDAAAAMVSQFRTVVEQEQWRAPPREQTQ